MWIWSIRVYTVASRPLYRIYVAASPLVHIVMSVCNDTILGALSCLVLNLSCTQA